MPSLTAEQLAALAQTGALNREIEAALGRAMTDAERAVVDKARVVLRLKRKAKKDAPSDSDNRMRRHREAARLVNIPQITADQYKRRTELEQDVGEWCRHYWPGAYWLPYSQAHRDLFSDVKTAIASGGRLAIAMPRGSGKTAVIRGGAVHAWVTGLLRFPVVIGKTNEQTRLQVIRAMWIMLASRDFVADYPEVGYPFSVATNQHQLAYQMDRRTGRKIGARHSADMMVLPDLDVVVDGQEIPSRCKGGVCVALGLTARNVRGTHWATDDGTILRPDFAFIDDPQTSDSAESERQTQRLVERVEEDVAGMGAVGASLPMVASVTVTRPGDFADQILDRTARPEWRGRRVRLLESMPTNLEAWEQAYNDERLAGLDADDGGKRAREYYLAHRAALDAGALAFWTEAYQAGGAKEPKHASTIQYAMDLYLTRKETFFCEYQNEPTHKFGGVYDLTEAVVAGRTNGLRRGQVPKDKAWLTLGIDINYHALSWAVVATRNDGNVKVLDYGAYPDRGAKLWTEGMAVTFGAAITRGLRTVVERCAVGFGRFDRVSVDGNRWPDDIYPAVDQLARDLPTCAADYVATRGRAGEQFRQPKYRRGVKRTGPGCVQMATLNGRTTLWFDSHLWHYRQQQGFFAAAESADGVSIFGEPGESHPVLAAHVCADRLLSIDPTPGGGQIMRWKQTGAENDLSDAVVLAMVAAGVEGTDAKKSEAEQQTNAGGSGYKAWSRNSGRRGRR